MAVTNGPSPFRPGFATRAKPEGAVDGRHPPMRSKSMYAPQREAPQKIQTVAASAR